MGLVFRHPDPGEMVGDYRILEQLGSGGFGTVFKAERAGLLFAVKMLGSSQLGARERREIGILLLLDLPGVARFRACDRWLDPKIGTPYIVTDFVPGLTLEEFANVENPSARKSARILLQSALTLGEVHLQGVFHRDLKPENIIIHGKNERPVLIDFGVGTYVGAPVITPHGLPPGTYEFRAPEAYLFQRANTGFAHYEFSAADELWALGVTFYWLLTNVLPFGDRNDWEGGGLATRILHMTPVAPHVLNPRVPRALSDLCMKMLEKKPEDRYTSVVELCAALGVALADAELDGGWDLPLFDPDAPDTRTTEEDPAMVDANEDEETRMSRKWAKIQPRRGRRPKREAEPAALEQDDIPTVKASQAPALLEASRAAPAPPLPVSRRRSRLVAAVVLGVVVLGGSLVARALRSSSDSAPLHTSSQAATTQQAESGHEVALSVKPLDPPGGEGAEPTTGSISAPVMLTMPGKNDTQEKPQEKKTKVLGRAGKVLAAGLVCKTLAGCPTPQVRPPPAPEPCPARAVEAMADKFGIHVGETVSASLVFEGPTGDITVREGPTSAELLGSNFYKPGGDILSGKILSGTFSIGEERVYGRFTEARDPKGDGQPFPVCFEMLDGLKGGRGAIRDRDGRIYSTVELMAVRHFK